MKANKARLQIKLSGPIGRLEVLGIRENAPVNIESVVDPASTVIVNISDSDLLTVTSEGDLSLGISGGDPARAQVANHQAPSAGRITGESSLWN